MFMTPHNPCTQLNPKAIALTEGTLNKGRRLIWFCIYNPPKYNFKNNLKIKYVFISSLLGILVV